VRFFISGIQVQPMAALERAGRLDDYGRGNFFSSLDDALAAASGILPRQMDSVTHA
jgi:preprotein translocase subunit SecA